MVKVVIGRRPDTNPNCYQTTSDTWALSTYEAWVPDYTWLYNLRMSEYMTICTWLYTWKIQDTWQWALSDAWTHMTIHDCSYTYMYDARYVAVSTMTQDGVKKKTSSLAFFWTSVGWSWVHMKYEKAKAHPWQLCRSLHWVWGSRPRDLWAIGSTKMTS